MVNIKTKKLMEVSSSILLAINADKKDAKLELSTNEDNLFLNVSNKEFFVSIKNKLDAPTEKFKVVLDAKAFLNLISAIDTDEILLDMSDGRSVKLQAGKSKYTVPIIMNGTDMYKVEPIIINDPTPTEVSISADIINSILNVNSREVQKLKAVDPSDIHKMFFISNEGCFTYTTGSCVNSFTLDKPVVLMLSERIIKLFKLFNTDVTLKTGVDTLIGGTKQTKISIETDDIYLGAVINSDQALLNKLRGNYESTKKLLRANYKSSVELPVDTLSSVLKRLSAFGKNTRIDYNSIHCPVKLIFTGTECLILDPKGNTESVEIIANNNQASAAVIVNAYDLKMILDSCEQSSVTMNFGLIASGSRLTPVAITHGSVSNLIPEWPEEEFK